MDDVVLDNNERVPAIQFQLGYHRHPRKGECRSIRRVCIPWPFDHNSTLLCTACQHSTKPWFHLISFVGGSNTEVTMWQLIHLLPISTCILLDRTYLLINSDTDQGISFVLFSNYMQRANRETTTVNILNIHHDIIFHLSTCRQYQSLISNAHATLPYDAEYPQLYFIRHWCPISAMRFESGKGLTSTGWRIALRARLRP